MPKECADFPGRFETILGLDGVSTSREFRLCNCIQCTTLWPRPEVAVGEWVEVAGEFGVYRAQVTQVYPQEDWSDGPMLFLEIESDDASLFTQVGAPFYERIVRWTVHRRNSLWRIYNDSTRWNPVPIEVRFNRKDVI